MGHNLAPRNKFLPTDDELIQLFLYNKVNGKPIPNYATILEYDLYGEENPWEIWEIFGGSNSYGEKDLYFFTNLKKKSLTSSRFVRTIGLGSWEAEDIGKDIIAKETNQCIIGLKKRFRFEKSGTEEDGAWIMHEYSLHSSLLSDSSVNNCVLCRFRKNGRHNPPKTGTKKTGQPETKVTGQKRTVVLGLLATIEFANDGLRKYIHKETRYQSESSDERTTVDESTTRTESSYEEQDFGDFTMFEPELFSLQLRQNNQGHLMEEDIPMLANTFYKDLLFERIVI